MTADEAADASDRRTEARLALSYPIRLHAEGDAPGVLGRTVTRNLSARGAYFSTFDGESYRVGQKVRVAITVPHRLAGSGSEVMLDLRGEGRVVRLDEPARPCLYGENGSKLTGVAIAFPEALTFRYAWA